MNTENNNTAQATNSTKSIILGIGIIAILIVLIASAGFIFFGEKEDIITGQVEVDEIRIAGKVPGRIAEFLVEEGQSVKEGDTLVRIYSPEVLAKLEQAEAAKAAAEAQNQKAIAGARKEQKEGAYELWQKAKAGIDKRTSTTKLNISNTLIRLVAIRRQLYLPFARLTNQRLLRNK